MKKQINAVTIMSVKSKISVIILCALLGAAEVNANNYSSLASNSISREIRPENKNEMNKNSTPYSINNTDEEVEVNVLEAMEQWIANGSYWSSEDTLSNEVKVPGDNKVVTKNTTNSNTPKIESNPFIFNAKSYISNSEF